MIARPQIFMPDSNEGELVTLSFREERIAKAIGRVVRALRCVRACLCCGCGTDSMRSDTQAARTITTGARVQGLIVARDFQYTVLDPVLVIAPRVFHGDCASNGCAGCSWCRDVEKVTELVTHQVKQTQHIPFRQSFPVLRMFLESMYVAAVRPRCESCGPQRRAACDRRYEDVEEYSDPGFKCLLVCGKVTVSYRPPDRVMLSWMASPSSDMVADSIAAVVLQASLGIAGMKGTQQPCQLVLLVCVCACMAHGLGVHASLGFTCMALLRSCYHTVHEAHT